MSALLGAVSFLVAVYQMADRIGSDGSTSAIDPVAVAAGVVQAGTAFTLALLVWISSGLIWVVLSNRIAGLEQAEAAALLAG